MVGFIVIGWPFDGLKDLSFMVIAVPELVEGPLYYLMLFSHFHWKINI